MANPLARATTSLRSWMDDLVEILANAGQTPGNFPTPTAAASKIPSRPQVGLGHPLPPPAAPAEALGPPRPPAIGGLGWSGLNLTPAADDVAEALPVIDTSAPAARQGVLDWLISRVAGRPASTPSPTIRLPSADATPAPTGLGRNFIEAQQAADEEEVARRLAAMNTGDATPVPIPEIRVTPQSPRPSLLQRASGSGQPSRSLPSTLPDLDESAAVDASRTLRGADGHTDWERKLLTGRFDGLPNMQGPRAELLKAVARQNVLKELARRKAAELASARSKAIGDAVGAAKDVATKWGGPAAVAAGVGAVAGEMANLAREYSPEPSQPVTEADLAAAVPVVAATPDEAPPAPAPVTPKQRAQAAEDFRQLEAANLERDRQDPAMAPVVANAGGAARARSPVGRAEQESEDFGSGLMRVLAPEQAAVAAAPLPSDNLAAVEQEITPDPAVKPKQGRRSSYDDPTRRMLLIKGMAERAGISDEEAQAIYDDGIARGLSDREAALPIVQMGNTNRRSQQARRAEAVRSQAMLAGPNARKNMVNAFNLMDEDERAFAMANAFTGGRAGLSPGERRIREEEARMRMQEAQLKADAEKFTASVGAGAQTAASWANALGMLGGRGLEAVSAYMNQRAESERAAADRNSRERISQDQLAASGEQARLRNSGTPVEQAQAELFRMQGDSLKATQSEKEAAPAIAAWDTTHGVPGATRLLRQGDYSTDPASEALKALARSVDQTTGGWSDEDSNRLDALLQQIGGKLAEDPALRNRIINQYGVNERGRFFTGNLRPE